MSSLRLWILVACGAFFAAGVGTGFVLSVRIQAPEERARLSDYERLFLSHFELTGARRETFSKILRAYDRDTAEIKSRHERTVHESMEGELERLARDYEQLVRDHVLTGEDRVRFDRLALGQPYTPTTN